MVFNKQQLSRAYIGETKDKYALFHEHSYEPIKVFDTQEEASTEYYNISNAVRNGERVEIKRDNPITIVKPRTTEGIITQSLANRKKAKDKFDKIQIGQELKIKRRKEETIGVTVGSGIVIFKDDKKLILRDSKGFKETFTLNDFTSCDYEFEEVI